MLDTLSNPAWLTVAMSGISLTISGIYLSLTLKDRSKQKREARKPKPARINAKVAGVLRTDEEGRARYYEF